MKYDIYAEFWDNRRRGADFRKLERVVGDAYQKVKLASLHLTTRENKEWARENKYKQWIIREYPRKITSEKSLLKGLIESDLGDLCNLTIPYLFIRISFKLRKPYLSRDDEDFYIIDNPIVKEKVFKIPYIRSTTWKGALRRVIKDIAAPEFEVRLFGNEKEGKESKQGRLFFYSTVLDRISLDVITPLDRVKKTPVRGPILFEIASEGAKGEFKLIYLPFDLIEKLSSEREEDRKMALNEIKEDLDILKEAIPKMMLEYGFSAKKTSGYGVVEEKLIKVRVNGQAKSNASFEEFKRMVENEYRRMVNEQNPNS